MKSKIWVLSLAVLIGLAFLLSIIVCGNWQDESRASNKNIDDLVRREIELLKSQGKAIEKDVEFEGAILRKAEEKLNRRAIAPPEASKSR